MATTTLLAIGYIPMFIVVILLIVLIYQNSKGGGSKASDQTLYPVIGPGAEKNDETLLEDGSQDPRDSDYERMKNKICALLEREKLYLNPDIRVSEIASRLCTNKNYVAQAIKSRMNKNFCQLIHFYRVREAMRIYALDPQMTMKELARSVGFNSMTTFNAAFSRVTGYTPAEWAREFKRQNNIQEEASKDENAQKR